MPLRLYNLLLVAPLLGALLPARAHSGDGCAQPLPTRLSQTGLYEAPETLTVDRRHQAVSPQYPLWSDATRKRRWMSLPPGTSIDASDADAWRFPVGTRLWKEFSYSQAIETRYIEHCASGEWRFAVYVWRADGRDADLAPAGGIARLPVADAPRGRYVVPSQADCRACHEGTPVPVLGISAIQLTASAQAARIASESPVERAALGYLHGNCGHCHNATGPLAKMKLELAQSAANPDQSLRRTRLSLLDQPSRFRGRDADHAMRVVAGKPDESVLLARMRTRNPYMQMPPLGTQIPDPEGLERVQRWITDELPKLKETLP